MRRTVLLTLWLITDALLFVGAYAVAYFWKVGWVLSSVFPLDRFLLAAALSTVPWLLVLATTRTFGLSRAQWTPRNLSYIVYACVVGGALTSLTYFFLFQAIFSRMLIVVCTVLSTLFIWCWHMVFERIERNMLRRDPPAYPMLVVGVTRESRGLIELLEKRKSPFRPVGILDAAGVKDATIGGIPVLGKLNKLGDVLRDKNITHLLQCSDLEQSINLLSACREAGITYMVLPSVFGIVERDETVGSLEGKPVTVVSPKSSAWEWFFR